jgi:hypothetical protein
MDPVFSSTPTDDLIARKPASTSSAPEFPLPKVYDGEPVTTGKDLHDRRKPARAKGVRRDLARNVASLKLVDGFLYSSSTGKLQAKRVFTARKSK